MCKCENVQIVAFIRAIAKTFYHSHVLTFAHSPSILTFAHSHICTLTKHLHIFPMNISVLILFFNRPEKLAALFAEVRKAQPARLFLYQDGARGEQDKAGIEACRKVVEEIDWPCEVHRLYQDKNYGCDPSNFMAQRWAFSLTDKCIVFEDDDIPSQSFFTFCKDMLDR